MSRETPQEAAKRRAEEAFNIMMSIDDDSLGPISAGRMVPEYDTMSGEERLAMYAVLETLC